MEKTISVPHSMQLSTLSFAPLIKYMKEKNVLKNSFSGDFFRSIEQTLLATKQPLCVPDANKLMEYEALVERMLALSVKETNDGLDFYAVTPPCGDNIAYSSATYKNFISQGNPQRHVVNKSETFQKTNVEVIYQIILKKFYGITLIHTNSFIYTETDEITGLKQILEYELDADFIDVTHNSTLPNLKTADLIKFFSEIKCNTCLEEVLPLHLFSLEGILLVKIRNVTVRESIGQVKNMLLTMTCFGDLKSFEVLQEQIKNLVDLADCSICLTSIVRENNLSNSNLRASNCLRLKPINFIQYGTSLWPELITIFETRASLLISNFSIATLSQFAFLQAYADDGIKSLVLFPLKFGKELVGIFSVVSNSDGSIMQHHVNRLEPLIPLLVLALGKQSEKMDDEIDRVIKEQFTAVQSSVNWKFTEAARNYINKKNNGRDSKIENIVFENVFPLYGSVDVRNSSVERSTAIQKDLLEQLNLADSIIRKCKGEIYLFSLQEISYRLGKFISTASLVLFPGDEQSIQNFLDDEITGLFNHLKTAVPSVSDDIDNYFFLLNASTNKISRQCAAFEESISIINNELVRFINLEQKKVQEIYAHYFEYFVTDGVDFNIYMGQSITPDKPFDQFYLKNLKLWQLTTLAKAARRVRDLQDQIPVRLDTTQLILAHSKPLSISFRVAERKFDVDGAYNIHYEIIKKRIDKIKVMGSCERLTQPGKIAIVFAHDKEAREYTSYIEYLQKEGLLENDIEYFELEELPGVRGLKALRVGIKMGTMEDVNTLLVENYRLKAVS